MLTKYQKNRIKRAIKLIALGVGNHSCPAICHMHESDVNRPAWRARQKYAEFYGFSSYQYWPNLSEFNRDATLQRELMLELFLHLNGDLNG